MGSGTTQAAAALIGAAGIGFATPGLAQTTIEEVTSPRRSASSENLTDELREASTFALATARTIGVTYLPPRTYGVTLGYRF